MTSSTVYMKTMNTDEYNKWPYARRSLLFLQAAKSIYSDDSRAPGSDEVMFYLLSHAIELIIKAIALHKSGSVPPYIHDKQELSEMYREECSFTDKEMEVILRLKELNNGSGGLRYDNQPIGDFSPNIFSDGVLIVERLLNSIKV